MDSNGKFWLLVWSIIGVTLTSGIIPISSCARNYHTAYYNTVQVALKKGCSVIEGANTLHVDCREAK